MKYRYVTQEHIDSGVFNVKSAEEFADVQTYNANMINFRKQRYRFLAEYWWVVGTNALIVGMGSLWTITMVLNLVMLKKRNLLEKTYLKTIGLVIFFGLVGALACYLVYNLFIRFTTLLISTCIAGVIGVGFMFGLYYVFNIAGFKGFLITKKRKVVS